jgi:hypothetical protein
MVCLATNTSWFPEPPEIAKINSFGVPASSWMKLRYHPKDSRSPEKIVHLKRQEVFQTPNHAKVCAHCRFVIVHIHSPISITIAQSFAEPIEREFGLSGKELFFMLNR